MEIEFGTKDLRAYFECKYSGKQPFSENIIEGYRKVATIMIKVNNIVMLSQYRSLNVEKYKEHWSARINDQFRVEFDFIKPNTIHLIKISKHYE
ncbi:MAG: hypothetical protein FVQ77_09770 [Cytophagales bacterium]|nr:hypothetical protein [Cytophagales bacterium]